ncbi:MAG: N-6 DNA methylase [Planctomycetes bacterium]|nr:N-6 DNA methylase [Planctomycetota bacterium]
MSKVYRNEFAAIRCEGDSITLEFLESLSENSQSFKGQKLQDFGIKDADFDEYVESIYRDVKQLYNANDDHILTSIPSLLGFKPVIAGKNGVIDLDGKKFNIKYLDSDISDYKTSPPLLLTNVYDIDKTSKDDGFSGRSPQSVFNEYLNASDVVWGVIFNGDILRAVRVSSKVTRFSYIEFDIRRIMDDGLINEFRLLFRICYRNRFPSKTTAPHECLLEQYHKTSFEEGLRARDQLRDNVKNALVRLGKAVVSSDANVNALDAYSELLRLTYRILFLLIAEERKLLTDNRLYFKYYSLTRLRDLAHSSVRFKKEEGYYYDLYEGLKTLFKSMQSADNSRKLGLEPLDGELYDELRTPIISKIRISNKHLLEAIHDLTTKISGSSYGKINFARIDVEELGSIYESLLELHPYTVNGNFDLIEGGNERKTSGSYYTPPELVNQLIETALIPVMDNRIKNANDKESAILSINVCDPACGSGHFLLAAARRLGKELARVRTGDDEPVHTELSKGVRDVITNCIYGVDKNPLAVELCKLALWVEGHCMNTPLTFLDDRIKCGDSLVGVFDINALKKGIPDDAFDPVEGDDKAVCKKLKAKNKAVRNTILLSPIASIGQVMQDRIGKFADKLKQIESIDESTIEGVHKARKIHEELKESPEWNETKLQCDLWMAPFFAEYQPENADKIPTSEIFNEKSTKNISKYCSELSLKNNFFHWQLEFPHIFNKGGFDVVLGNPPWERIKLQEQEFFATRDKEIAEAANKAARSKLIKALPRSNPGLFEEFMTEKHYAESSSKFIRASKRFELTARGDINTYSIFAELDRELIGSTGRAGFIVPTGIATDDTCKVFFADLVEKNSLVSLYDFENKEGIFPAVHRQYKFSLVTLKSPSHEKTETDFVFFAQNIGHLNDERRHFTLTKEDFELINPNTLTCPIFRTKYDAELTKKIYRRVPVLVNEKTGENPWNVKFMRMFDMANDSHLFKTREELESAGYILQGNRFIKGAETFLPLYEAKMIWQYDHRYGTYEGRITRGDTHLSNPELSEYQNAEYNTIPWYWVLQTKVIDKIGNRDKSILIALRRYTTVTNERTTILSLLPFNAIADSITLARLDDGVIKRLLFTANHNSVAIDFIIRNKFNTQALLVYVINQIPIIEPEEYHYNLRQRIIINAIEVIFTAWDYKPFADDLWKEADPELRKSLLAQWEENCEATNGGHMDAKPPEWLDHDAENGFPKPPFMWDEDRRARLKAELDAYYAMLYGLTDEELRYILDPKDVFGEDYPGETFRVLKEKEIRQFGEYRTKRLILEAWEKLKSGKIKQETSV